jgi:hypothetical protein
VIELTPRRIGRLPADTRNFECCRVRHRNMPIHPAKQRRMTGSYPIEILPGWERLVGPQRMIPTTA